MFTRRDSHGRSLGPDQTPLPHRLDPIPHFQKCDQRNLTAANATLAELRFREKDNLVTPPEKLASWALFTGMRISATKKLSGDPDYARSALGGWVPVGSQ